MVPAMLHLLAALLIAQQSPPASDLTRMLNGAPPAATTVPRPATAPTLRTTPTPAPAPAPAAARTTTAPMPAPANSPQPRPAPTGAPVAATPPVATDAAAAEPPPAPPVVLDARNYGVPQRRRRVFILGVLPDAAQDDFTWPPPPTHAPAGASGLLPWRNCSEAFRPAAEGDPNDLHMNHSADLVAAFARTPINGGSRHQSGRLLNCHRDHDGHNDVYGRMDPAKPAPTMTTACINPSKGRFVHPVENHGITLWQAARIQTFPDSFSFTGGLMAAGSQIGNAVPVVLGRSLLEYLNDRISFAVNGLQSGTFSACQLGPNEVDGFPSGKVADGRLASVAGVFGLPENPRPGAGDGSVPEASMTVTDDRAGWAASADA